MYFTFRIEKKNMRGICPLDLAPELRSLQQTCVEELFKVRKDQLNNQRKLFFGKISNCIKNIFELNGISSIIII